MNQQTHRRASGVWIAILALLVLSPELLTAATRIDPGFNLFSPAQDVEIGRQSAIQADRQLPLVASRSVNSYVNAVGRRLAAAAPGPDFDYRFKVVNASDLNAFALPGGYVYVNRGVLESADSEGEVAGVLAHEIAHVALRHGTHNASRAYLTQAGLGILGGLLGGRVGRNTAQVLNVVGGVGLNALFLRYSRTAESQADVLGAQIMARAGYDPNDMADFFRTLERTDRRRTIGWLSDHPSPSSRIQRIEREAKLLGGRRNRGNSRGELAAVQSQLRRLGPAPRLARIAG